MMGETKAIRDAESNLMALVIAVVAAFGMGTIFGMDIAVRLWCSVPK